MIDIPLTEALVPEVEGSTCAVNVADISASDGDGHPISAAVNGRTTPFITGRWC